MIKVHSPFIKFINSNVCFVGKVIQISLFIFLDDSMIERHIAKHLASREVRDHKEYFMKI